MLSTNKITEKAKKMSGTFMENTIKCLKDIKEDLNKWRNALHIQIQKLSIIKMTIFPSTDPNRLLEELIR